jgi:hypothetical protein
MKRSIVLLAVLTALLATSAAPAQADDRRIEFILGLAFAKADYIANRVTTTDSSFAKFGRRLSALARREARRMVRAEPSTKAGAIARHQTIQGLKELRISGELWVRAASATPTRRVARLAFRATVKLHRGLYRLVYAAKALTGA